MKKSIPLLLLLATSFSFYKCAYNKSLSSSQPDFAYNGKTIDSLKKIYDCESIEYENWEATDTRDDRLTVCLVNSKIIDANKNKDDSTLMSIASSIKKALVNPAGYQSFYIIFITKNMVNGVEEKIHTMGADIPSKELQ